MPRSLHHSIHFEYTLFPPKLRWLFMGHLLRGAAQQTVSLFIPIYLYMHADVFPWWSKIPFSSQWGSLVRGVLMVCLYYVVTRSIEFLLAIPLSRVIKKLGLVKSMIVGNIVLLMFYAALSFTGVFPVLFLLIPILSAIEIPLYWMSYHTLFAVNADVKLLGQEVGSFQFLDKLLRAALPMIGGVIAGVFGFQTLNIFGAILIFGACIFLIPVHETVLSFTVSWSEFFQWCKSLRIRNVICGFIGNTIDDISREIWIVYVLIFFGTVERVGYAYSVVLFLSLFITYFMGWYLGKHKGRTALFMSGGCMSMLWWFRMFIQTMWHFFAIDILDRLVVSVFVPIFDTLFYKASHGKMVFHFYVFREMIISITSIVFWMTIGLLFILPFQWIGVFALASIGTLLSLRMAKDHV